jgi:hypothetical protein
MDPRLRAAVDASRQWYDDVFALHGIAVRVEDGLWSALAPPPPWHSAAKTLEPGVEAERVVRTTAGLDHCAVADSFGDLDLGRHGFEVLIEATWLHRAPDRQTLGPWPGDWSVVASADDLSEWVTAHDYAGVLTRAVLDHPRFRVLACRRDGRLVGGAVAHDGGGALGLSNGWGAGGLAGSTDILAAVSAMYPGRAMVDYAAGEEREAMVAAGFTPLGPHRVWTRRDRRRTR